jgi:hypothetical protein
MCGTAFLRPHRRASPLRQASQGGCGVRVCVVPTCAVGAGSWPGAASLGARGAVSKLARPVGHALSVVVEEVVLLRMVGPQCARGSARVLVRLRTEMHRERAQHPSFGHAVVAAI